MEWLEMSRVVVSGTSKKLHDGKSDRGGGERKQVEGRPTIASLMGDGGGAILSTPVQIEALVCIKLDDCLFLSGVSLER